MKYVIKCANNGKYVKSLSHSKCTYTFTTDVTKAKKYAIISMVFAAIDDLVYYASLNGEQLIFTYDIYNGE